MVKSTDVMVLGHTLRHMKLMQMHSKPSVCIMLYKETDLTLQDSEI